jgi:hypothetical protein
MLTRSALPFLSRIAHLGPTEIPEVAQRRRGSVLSLGNMTVSNSDQQLPGIRAIMILETSILSLFQVL